MTDHFPDPPQPDAASTHQERLTQAHGDAIVGIADLRQAISAFEQALHGARHTLATMRGGVPTEAALTAWRASNALIEQALTITKASASILDNAVGVMLFG
jgi:hypothetical protein